MQTTNDQNQSGQNLNNQGPVLQTSGCNGHEPARPCPSNGEDQTVCEFGYHKILNGQNQGGQNDQSLDQVPRCNGHEPTRRCPSSGEGQPVSQFGIRKILNGPNNQNNQNQSGQNQSSDQALGCNGHGPARRCPRSGKAKPLSEFGYRSMGKGFIR